MNKHTGKDTVYIDGRCTSIAYVRIGDEVIFSKEDAVKGEAAKETQAAKLATVEAPAQVPDDLDTSTGELEQEVTLDPKAEDFEARKARIKSLGYVWDELEPEVTLDPTAQDFEARKAELKSLGYAWNGDNKVWSL